MSSLPGDLSELLVHGFIKTFMGRKIIAMDVLSLCFEFYYSKPHFIGAGSKCTIDNDEGIVSYSYGGYRHCKNSCFVSIPMSCKSDIDYVYKYKIKIISLSNDGELCFGICDQSIIKEYFDNDWCGKKKFANYAYSSLFGCLLSNKGPVQSYGISFDEGDLIQICYNPFKGNLWFMVNNNKQPIIEHIQNNHGLIYCLAVYLGEKGNQKIQLL